jgi:hypothetical protein
MLDARSEQILSQLSKDVSHLVAPIGAGEATESSIEHLPDVAIVHFVPPLSLYPGFMAEGTLSIPELDLDAAYSYNLLENNLNLLSISRLSSKSRKTMHECEDCDYYPMYEKYVGFYGRFDYADHIITSAFHGDRTALNRGSMDFGIYSEDGKTGALYSIVDDLGHFADY